MKTKVKDLTEEQLDYWCAKAQGWWLHTDRYMGTHAEGHEVYMDWWMDRELSEEHKTNEYIASRADYQPTSNTEKGKAQCFDLMVKFGVFTNDFKNLQRSVCEIVVISVFGEEVEL